MLTKKHVPCVRSRRYQITVEGEIDPSWSDWLGGMQLTSWQESDGTYVTTLSGVVVDQAALRGILIRLWDLNLILRSLQEDDPVKMPTANKEFLA